MTGRRKSNERLRLGDDEWFRRKRESSRDRRRIVRAGLAELERVKRPSNLGPPGADIDASLSAIRQIFAR